MDLVLDRGAHDFPSLQRIEASLTGASLADGKIRDDEKPNKIKEEDEGKIRIDALDELVARMRPNANIATVVGGPGVYGSGRTRGVW
jgi:hypothetical protein